MNNDVLLTGASGFIGQHCIKALINSGFRVNAVSSRVIRNHDRHSLTWHHADLHNAEHVLRLLSAVKPAYLLHLAWDVTPGLYWQSISNLRWLKSSLVLLQSFIESGGKRVVMAGSCAEYDWQYGYCREHLTPLKPHTLYGVCKSALQQVLVETANQAGISAAWGRIFSVYGPGEDTGRLIPSLLINLLSGKEAVVQSGHRVRDYIYVKDAAGAFTALLKSDLQGPVNIASGRPLSLAELAFRIADFAGRRDLLQLAAKEEINSEPDFLLAHTGRLVGELKYELQYTLDAGMQETGLYWQKKLEKDLE